MVSERTLVVLKEVEGEGGAYEKSDSTKGEWWIDLGNLHSSYLSF